MNSLVKEYIAFNSELQSIMENVKELRMDIKDCEKKIFEYMETNSIDTINVGDKSVVMYSKTSMKRPKKTEIKKRIDPELFDSIFTGVECSNPKIKIV